MLGKSRWVAVVVLATIMSLVGVASALAQSGPGYGSMAAMGNETGWVTIDPGQQHWYTFFSTTADSAATDAQIMVTMASSPQGGASFNVWTPAALQSFYAGNTDINAKPTGSGTLHQVKDGDSTFDRFGGNLEWTGKSLSPQIYMVQVESNASTPVMYNLMTDGNYLRYTYGTLASQAASQNVKLAKTTQQPAQPAMQTTSAGATASMSAATNQQVAMTPASNASNLPAPVVLPSTGQSASPALGSSPSMGLALDGHMRTLNPGQSAWYVLQYPGELKGGFIPQASVELLATPQNGANFKVWTAEGLRALAAGDTTVGIPVGAGTMHQFTDGGVTFDRWGGNPEWTNKSKFANTFYIEVQNSGSNPVAYMLRNTQQ